MAKVHINESYEYNHVDDKRMRDEIEKFDEKRSRDSRVS